MQFHGAMLRGIEVRLFRRVNPCGIFLSMTKWEVGFVSGQLPVCLHSVRIAEALRGYPAKDNDQCRVYR